MLTRDQPYHLKCIELLRNHLDGTEVLDIVEETFSNIKPMLTEGSVLVQTLLEKFSTKDRTLAQCLLARHIFITMPESDYKLSMDGDNVIVLNEDHVACIHPAFYRLNFEVTEG
jgi:hypothetical protein